MANKYKRVHSKGAPGVLPRMGDRERYHSHPAFPRARRVENGTQASRWIQEFIMTRGGAAEHVHYKGVTEDGTLVYWLDMPAGDTVLHIFKDQAFASAWYTSVNDAREDLAAFNLPEPEVEEESVG